MKAYPSIPLSKDSRNIGEPCIGFYKYDGSNLRWEWSKKQGWHKFGTRTRLFGKDEEPYNQAIPLFLETMGDALISKVTANFHVQDFIVYTEFFGESSFAGAHVLNEPKSLILLDVWIPRKSFILPKQFIKLFSNESWMPEVVYEGNLNQKLIKDVYEGKYNLDEGMMCKGFDKRQQQWMAKIKTKTYLDKLKTKYGEGWEKMI